jgi:hypothetical protein
MIDDDEYVVGGMRIGGGNRIIRRKPAPVSFCPPQIPHDLTWARTTVAALGNRQLTSWAMARPSLFVSKEKKLIKRTLFLTTYICRTSFPLRPVPVPPCVVHIQLTVTLLYVQKVNQSECHWLLLRLLNVTGSKQEQINYWAANITHLSYSR